METEGLTYGPAADIPNRYYKIFLSAHNICGNFAKLNIFFTYFWEVKESIDCFEPLLSKFYYDDYHQNNILGTAHDNLPRTLPGSP